MEIEKAPKGVEVLKRDIIEYIIFSLLLVLLILSESYNFLLFHTLAEIFSIIIAGGVFLIGWNSRKYMKNSFFLIVGISFLFVAIIDLFHTLAYTGLPIFIGYTSNLPTQLWIAARYIQASSILIAVLFFKKKVPSRLLIGVYSTMTFFLIFLIFQGFFPDCYVEGVGLTPFKIISEYVIILLLIISLIGLYKHGKEFNPRVLTLINLFIGAMIISEFSFTLYISTYGFANFLGHVFKIIAFFFVYKAIIEISLQEPYNLLFRKLKSSQEKAEEAYAETEQIFNASLPLRILNLACDIIKVNDTFCELFNVERSDILGKKCYNVMRHSHCDTDLCALNQITGGKNKAIYETNYDLDQNGQKEITVIINAVPYKSSEGELLGIIQNFIDITKRKKAEERLEQFISTASHELRTPITVLVHSMELLEKYKNEMTQEQIEEMLNRLPRNVSLLSELVEDLLLISRLNEDQMEIVVEKFKPLDLVKNILKNFDYSLAEKNIRVEYHIDPELILLADPLRIEQIFRVFIDNAIKYSSPNSKIVIKAVKNYSGRYNPEGKKGDLFQIIDFGRGIKEEAQQKLFERFFRAKDVANIPGTGLGLAIAKEIMDIFGGSIYVDSTYGEGSTFSLFFPKK